MENENLLETNNPYISKPEFDFTVKPEDYTFVDAREERIEHVFGTVSFAQANLAVEKGQIEYVDLTENIIADKDTHILYVYYSGGYQGFLCPYYSENGKLCKYEDGKFIEVVNTDGNSN